MTKIRRLCREGLAEGWTHFKLKVGGDAAHDLRRGAPSCAKRSVPERYMMVDANQRWGVEEAIRRTRQLEAVHPVVDGRAHQSR